MEVFLHALEHSLEDTIMVVPVLYLAYLLVSYFSHNDNEKYSRILHHTKKAGPVIGAFLGCVPQCGFSSVMSQLYSKKIVSVGTLIAVFIATSDEAIPLMIANPAFIPKMLLMIAIKVVYAIIIGYLIDGLYRLFSKKKIELKQYHHPEEEGTCPYMPVEVNNQDKQELIEVDCACHTHHKEHTHEHEEEQHGHNHKHCCATNIFLDALRHTLIIVLYVFIATFIIELISGYCNGLEPLQRFFTDNAYVQILLASLIGLIPNCASSVFLVELYMQGVLIFPALLAGLTAGAGVGFIVLWSVNYKNAKTNLLIMLGQYVFALILGIILNFFPF